MEAAFKMKLNVASKKKNGKAGHELDSFIVSTIPKEVAQNDNASLQRLWLEASFVLAAIVDKFDVEEILESEIIYWVLQTVQGYMIDFTQTPHQSYLPPPIVTSPLW